MSHLGQVISAAQNAFKRNALEELYSKPAPYVGRFHLALFNIRTTGYQRLLYVWRMQPATVRGHVKPYLSDEEEDRIAAQTREGIVFSPDTFLNLPYEKSYDYGDSNSDYAFVSAMREELTTLGIQAHTPGHVDHSDQFKFDQCILFVPLSRLKYLDDNKDLPIETNSGDQMGKFLAYLLVKGLLDPNNAEDLDIIRETFLVPNPLEDGRTQRYSREFGEKLAQLETQFDPHIWPKYNPEVAYE